VLHPLVDVHLEGARLAPFGVNPLQVLGERLAAHIAIEASLGEVHQRLHPLKVHPSATATKHPPILTGGGRSDTPVYAAKALALPRQLGRACEVHYSFRWKSKLHSDGPLEYLQPADRA